ncbi:LysM peptidoglycan-binding domain-containing protein, partial [Klebsiella pneumoniae subsp. pneumoniae]|nr:LysM peptidoglycan-binding domain-containing protein [Klebsiella pneumoniae subsp. pneumoniae]
FNTKKLGLFGLVTLATLGATALANAETYTFQKGYTLSAIAKKNCTTVDEIISKNGIQAANTLSIGQKLTINETTY